MPCSHCGSEQHLPWRWHLRHAHAGTITDRSANCGADCCTHGITDSITNGCTDARPQGLPATALTTVLSSGPTRAPRLPRQHPRLRPQRVIFIPIRCSHGYSHCCVPTTGPNEAPTAAPTAVPTSAPTCTTATVPTCKGGWAYSFSAHSYGAVTSDRSTYCDSYLHADIHAYFWSYRSSYQCTDGRPIPSRPPLLLQHRLPLRLRCPHGYVVCHIH